MSTIPKNQPGHSLPSREQTLFKRLLKCYEQKQFKNGLKFVKQILSNPKCVDHGETWAMKGLLLNCLGKREEALECVHKGLKMDVKSQMCWNVYGTLQLHERKYKEAIKCYRQALKLDEKEFEVLKDLAKIQLHLRDLESYKEIRYTLFRQRPGQQTAWINLALSENFVGNLEMCLRIITEFINTQNIPDLAKTNAYEMSELLQFKIWVLILAGKYQQALNELDGKDVNSSDQKPSSPLFQSNSLMLDQLFVQESRAYLQLKLHLYPQALKTLTNLLMRNQENALYYNLMEYTLNVMSGRDLSVKERVMIYTKALTMNPKALMAQIKPLCFLSLSTEPEPTELIKSAAQISDKQHHMEFETLFKTFLHKHLVKGTPSLFKLVKEPIYHNCFGDYYDNKNNVKIVNNDVRNNKIWFFEQLLHQLLLEDQKQNGTKNIEAETKKNVENLKTLENEKTEQDNDDDEHIEKVMSELDFKNKTSSFYSPSYTLWLTILLSRHYTQMGQFRLALFYNGEALRHTPTLIDLYVDRAKIYRKNGNYVQAYVYANKAQSLDTADRYLNCLAGKCALKAYLRETAKNILGKFTKENVDPFLDLTEFQALWFLLSLLKTYNSMGDVENTLKTCHSMYKILKEMSEDEFDYHTYCPRKMTLITYVKTILASFNMVYCDNMEFNPINNYMESIKSEINSKAAVASPLTIMLPISSGFRDFHKTVMELKNETLKGENDGRKPLENGNLPDEPSGQTEKKRDLQKLDQLFQYGSVTQHRNIKYLLAMSTIAIKTYLALHDKVLEKVNLSKSQNSEKNDLKSPALNDNYTKYSNEIKDQINLYTHLMDEKINNNNNTTKCDNFENSENLANIDFISKIIITKNTNDKNPEIEVNGKESVAKASKKKKDTEEEKNRKSANNIENSNNTKVPTANGQMVESDQLINTSQPLMIANWFLQPLLVNCTFNQNIYDFTVHYYAFQVEIRKGTPKLLHMVRPLKCMKMVLEHNYYSAFPLDKNDITNPQMDLLNLNEGKNNQNLDKTLGNTTQQLFLNQITFWHNGLLEISQLIECWLTFLAHFAASYGNREKALAVLFEKMENIGDYENKHNLEDVGKSSKVESQNHLSENVEKNLTDAILREEIGVLNDFILERCLPLLMGSEKSQIYTPLQTDLHVILERAFSAISFDSSTYVMGAEHLETLKTNIDAFKHSYLRFLVKLLHTFVLNAIKNENDTNTEDFGSLVQKIYRFMAGYGLYRTLNKINSDNINNNEMTDDTFYQALIKTLNGIEKFSKENFNNHCKQFNLFSGKNKTSHFDLKSCNNINNNDNKYYINASNLNYDKLREDLLQFLTQYLSQTDKAKMKLQNNTSEQNLDGENNGEVSVTQDHVMNEFLEKMKESLFPLLDVTAIQPFIKIRVQNS